MNLSLKADILTSDNGFVLFFNQAAIHFSQTLTGKTSEHYRAVPLIALQS